MGPTDLTEFMLTEFIGQKPTGQNLKLTECFIEKHREHRETQ